MFVQVNGEPDPIACENYTQASFTLALSARTKTDCGNSKRNLGSHIYKTLTNPCECGIISHVNPFLCPQRSLDAKHKKEKLKKKKKGVCVYAEMDGGQHLHLTSIITVAGHIIVNLNNPSNASTSKNSTLITLIFS